MAAESARDLVIKYSADNVTYTAVAGARQDALTVNNEHIDITTKSDAGVRQYLDDIAVKSMSMTVSGVTKDATFVALAAGAAAGSALHYFSVDVGSFHTYTGQWAIPSFEVTGEDGGAIEFSMTLESAGAIAQT